MATPLKAFTDAKNKSAVAALVKQSIANAAKAGAPVKFVAAKNYKIGNEVMSVFLWVDKPAEFLAVIKKQGGLVKFAEGKALVTKDAKNNHKIVVQTVVPGSSITHNDVSTLIKPAAGNADQYVGTTPAREQAEIEQAESDAAKRAKPDPVAMLKASHAQAREEGLIDWDVVVTQQVLAAHAASLQQVPEFAKFSANFKAFMTKHGLSDPVVNRLPVELWTLLFKGLVKSGYVKSKIPKATDGTSFILAYQGPQGAPVREQMLQDAMDGLKPFVDHASLYLDMVASKAKQGATWAFWSGRGAEDAAKASGGMSLEGEVGSFFGKYLDEWIKWPKLVGNDQSELPLWTSMSEMYAEKAAQYVDTYKFIGFLGPTGTRDQSVFNKIEQPVFINVLKSSKKATPHIDWYVVDCSFSPNKDGNDTFKGEKGWWNWNKAKAHEKFTERSEAQARIVTRYEF